MRKQKKLTLETLAGNELTKGMLSLIENNKANPSMESLNYIAARLGVEASELLEEVSMQELREVLEKAENLINTEFNLLTDEYEQLISLVEPYVQKLTQGYEAARLLEMHGRCLYHYKKEGWQTSLDRAARMYEQMNVIPRRASIGVFRAMVKFREHRYEQSLTILLRERAEIEGNNGFIDPVTRLDFDYAEAVLHFAVGDAESAIRVMESAIQFSKEKRVFYGIDNLYRIAAVHATMTCDEEKRNYYQKKMEQYADFAEDKEAAYFAEFIEIHALNSYKKEHQKASDLLQEALRRYDGNAQISPFLQLEQGKALYALGHFKEALDWLKQVVIHEYMHHPIDLSFFYEGDAYAARCYCALGNKEEALRYAQKAMDRISQMPHTRYKDFITETYEWIMK